MLSTTGTIRRRAARVNAALAAGHRVKKGHNDPRLYRAGQQLAQPLQQVKAALEALEHLPRTRLVTCSSFYRTKPLGPQNQPDFLNAVVALDTLLPPEQLLDHTGR